MSAFDGVNDDFLTVARVMDLSAAVERVTVTPFREVKGRHLGDASEPLAREHRVSLCTAVVVAIGRVGRAVARRKA